MSPVGENLFTALTKGLADFRAQVEGEPGRKVLALRTSSGTLPDLANKVLSAVEEALAWLAGALERVEDVLRRADALVALVEMATELVGALATCLDFERLPPQFGLDTRLLEKVTAAANSGSLAMDAGKHLAGLVPSPEQLNGLRQELKRLLGALGQLLADLNHRPP